MKRIIIATGIILIYTFTAFAQAPQIVGTTPGLNALNVNPSVNITATFNIDMDGATINDTTFLVFTDFGGLKEGLINYNGTTITATFNPISNFKNGDHVTVILTRAIKSSTGIPMADGFSWSFTIQVSEAGDYYVVDSSYTVGGTAEWVEAADFNHDGFIDLATATHSTGNASVLMNNGDGTFAEYVAYSISGIPTTIYTADLDNDNDVDMVLSNRTINAVSVLLNNGFGTFAPVVQYSVGNAPHGITGSDLDGDGYIDLAIPYVFGGSVSFLLNDGDGTFGGHYYRLIGDTATALVCADFDGDGIKDLAAASYVDSISVFKNDGDGIFYDQTNYFVDDGLIYVMVAPDIDGDADLDLVLAQVSHDRLSVLFNNGNGVFSSHTMYDVANSPYFVHSADLDADGDLDLLTAHHNTHAMTILTNNGDGTFFVDDPIYATLGPRSIVTADFDNDGDNDIARANNQSLDVKIHKRVLYGAVTGTVVDSSTNLPLEDVVISIPGTDKFDTTDAAGQYMLPDLVAATLGISYYKPRYYQGYVPGVVVGNGDTVVVDYALQPIPLGVVLGTVTDEMAAPIESVYIFREGTQYETYTDENGDYLLETFTGYGQFTFQKSGYYDTTEWIGINLDDTVTVDMTMRQLLPGVRGKVLNMHPVEVESVLVSVLGTSFSTYTDWYGEFIIEGLDPGIYDISFEHPFYIDTIITDIPAEPGLYDSLEVILVSSSAVTGHVFSLADSLPLSGVLIYAYIWEDICDFSDSSGQYYVRLVPQVNYHLYFRKANYHETLLTNIMVGVGETLTLDNVYMEPYPGEAFVWYGNMDGSPIMAPINETIFLDLYYQKGDSAEVCFLHLPLAFEDQYIVDHHSDSLGVLYYPLTDWDVVTFEPPIEYGVGWHSQSLLGFSDIGGGINPFLICPEPTRIATFAFQTANDSTLIGDTVYCFTEGYHPANGGPLFGDCDGVTPYYPVQYFSPLVFTEPVAGNCQYVVGDANNSEVYNGLDITYGVAYFKGSPPPPYECECTQGNTWYVAGDVNASCDFNGLDITYGVAYFKGGDAPQPCPDCPPTQ
jgi:hypothetical protein